MGMQVAHEKYRSSSWPRQFRGVFCIPQALPGVNRRPAPFARLCRAPVLPVPPSGVTPRLGGLRTGFATDATNSMKGENHEQQQSETRIPHRQDIIARSASPQKSVKQSKRWSFPHGSVQ
jgi:hypothetical protein